MVATTVALAVAACAPDPDDGAGSQTGSPVATGPVTTEIVSSIDNNFLPQVLTIAVGTEVVFENNGRNDHDVIPVADPEAISWGVQAEQFMPGDTYSHVFTEPGTYQYYCTIHGIATAGMFGSIVVTDA